MAPAPNLTGKTYNASPDTVAGFKKASPRQERNDEKGVSRWKKYERGQ